MDGNRQMVQKLTQRVRGGIIRKEDLLRRKENTTALLNYLKQLKVINKSLNKKQI